MANNIWALKSITNLMKEAEPESGHTLKRTLTRLNLVTLGIGAIIGAGIFVLSGQAAANYAGPAVTISFVVAGLACVFAGFPCDYTVWCAAGQAAWRPRSHCPAPVPVPH